MRYVHLLTTGILLKHLLSTYLLCVALLVCEAVASQEFSPGLRFLYDKNDKTWGTFLDLTSNGPVKVSGSYSVAFDMMILDPYQFGHVFEIHGDEGFFCRLTYSTNPSAPDSALLALSVNGRYAGGPISFPKDAFHKGRWYSLLIVFDTNENRVRLSLDGRELRSGDFQLPTKFNFSFVFGSKTPWHIPAMVVRHIRVASLSPDGKPAIKHHWPLAEATGEDVRDVAGGKTGRQIHGEWMAPAHTRWKYVRSFRGEGWITDYAAFDAKRSRLLIVGRTRLIDFSFITQNTTEIKYANARPGGLREFEAVGDYDNFNDRLLAMFAGSGEVTIFNEETRRWSAIDTSRDVDQHFYGQARIIDQTRGDLYMFGGYGWYKAKNLLQKYDYSSRTWDTVKVSGDMIEPRLGTGVASSHLANKVYLFGGLGNESGDQQAGYMQFNDLWLIDLFERTMKRLWVLPPSEQDLHPVGFVYPRGAPSGYALKQVVRPLEGPATLYRVEIEKPVMTSVAEPLPATQHVRHLFFDERHRQLIAVGLSEGAGSVLSWQVYTLDHPALVSPIASAQAETHSSTYLWIWIAGGVLLAGLAGVFFWRRRRVSSAQGSTDQSPQPVQAHDIAHLQHEPQRSAIMIFGGFQVVDSAGEDISAEFSPKIKQLFLMILLKSTGYTQSGVTIEEISSTLWPDVSAASAKNSRGVALKTLRDLLTRIGEVSVINEKRMLRLEIHPDINSDYHQFSALMQLLKKGSAGSDSMLSAAINIAHKGVILPTISYEWLDPIRASITHDVTDICLEKIGSTDGKNSPEAQLRAAETLLRWDPLNEDGLHACVQALSAMRKTGGALSVYEAFTAEYEETFGRPYPHSMSELLDREMMTNSTSGKIVFLSRKN